jgi:outer membrane protein insertion porin family
MKEGDWYNAKLVEDTIEAADRDGRCFGYAFADVRRASCPNRDNADDERHLRAREAPRVYVERIDINGNTLTQDKVVRREFRLAEGDAFNSSGQAHDRAHQFAGLFPGELRGRAGRGQHARPHRPRSQPAGRADRRTCFRPVSRASKASFFQGSIRQRNFRGRGQTVGPVAQLFALFALRLDQLLRTLPVRSQHLRRHRHLPARLQQRLLQPPERDLRAGHHRFRCAPACR